MKIDSIIFVFLTAFLALTPAAQAHSINSGRAAEALVPGGCILFGLLLYDYKTFLSGCAGAFCVGLRAYSDYKGIQNKGIEIGSRIGQIAIPAVWTYYWHKVSQKQASQKQIEDAKDMRDLDMGVTFTELLTQTLTLSLLENHFGRAS